MGGNWQLQVKWTGAETQSWHIAGLREVEQGVEWCSWKQGKHSFKEELPQEQDK